MNDPDARTLTAVGTGLVQARNSLPDVRMTTPPEQIIARARNGRRRNRIAIAAATSLGLAVGAALSVSLTATPPAAPPIASQHRAVQIRTAAVVRGRGGIVTLTIRQARGSDGLRRALAHARVPALVLFRHVCDYPALPEVPTVPAVFPGIGHNGAGVWLKIKPSAMPAGTTILIGFQASPDLVATRKPRRPGQGTYTFIDLVWN